MLKNQLQGCNTAQKKLSSIREGSILSRRLYRLAIPSGTSRADERLFRHHISTLMFEPSEVSPTGSLYRRMLARRLQGGYQLLPKMVSFHFARIQEF